MGKDYVISEIERNHIQSLLEQKKRTDGRELSEFRKITIETEYVKKAEGSAVVSIGDTRIIVGVKAILGTPFPDSPDSGVITTSAELSPLASRYFESGPPSEAAIELARVTDRAIRESHVIDLSKLCIVPGKSVWILFIDMYILNDDGNLFDAAALGAMAALATTKIKKVKIVSEEPLEKEILDELEPLKVDHQTVSVTSYKIGNYNIFDPNGKEDRISDARITFGFDEQDRIVSMQKGKLGVYTPEEIKTQVRECLNVSKTLRKELMKAIPK
ncbi:MAG: exosome complex protein Rrp42 [Candidatus Heimdallarchaeaceae archaeon]